MKRRLLLFIGVLIVFVAYTHAQTISVNNIKFLLNTVDNTASITGNTIIDSTILILPDTVRYNENVFKVTGIAANAFKSNTKLKGKIIFNTTSLKTIGVSAFEGCTSISDTLRVPETVTTIGASAFKDCNHLVSVGNLSSGLTGISASLFQGCSGLKSVLIPSLVTTIGDYAFDGCTGLSDTIKISSAVTGIGLYSFRNCKKGVNVALENTNYSSQNGILFNKNTTTIIQVPIDYTGVYEIPSTITAIGAYSFYRCSSITGISLPNSLITIGTYAFSGCSKIESILNIPASVTSIGKFAFQGCTKITTLISPTIRISAGSYPSELTNITLTGNIDARDFKILRDSTNVNKLNLSGATIVAFTGNGGTASASATYPANTIPVHAFSYPGTLLLITTSNPIITVRGKTGLKSIEFPAGATAIGNYAFATCTGLSGEFKIPAPIATIGNGAFLDCAEITNFVFPETLTAIGDNTFERCIGLNKQLVFPTALKSIGTYGFSACSNIPDEILIPEGFTTMGTYAFQSCRKIETATLPASLKTISAGLFSNCDNLLSVNIPELVTSIGANCFEYCSKIKNIVLPTTIATLGGYAFYQCLGLTDITLPTVLQKIDVYTFYNCTNLRALTLPGSLTTIGDFAFYNCTGISEFNFPATLKTIGKNSFSCCTKLKTITLPDLVTVIPDYSFSGCVALETINLPSELSAIGPYAFFNCTSLVNSTLPNNLKTIGDVAFSNCVSLSDVTIPAMVNSIGLYAFTNCSAGIFVNESNANYSSADSILFNKDKSTLIQSPVFKHGHYTIPTTVTTIGAYSFYFCSNLTSVNIPATVITIGAAAFYNCNSLISIITNSAAPVNLTGSDDVFYNIGKSCILQVPIGSKNEYLGAPQWNGIYKIVESATAIDDVEVSKICTCIINGQLIVSNTKVNQSISVYSLSGSQLISVKAADNITSITLPAKGVYVVRIGNRSQRVINM